MPSVFGVFVLFANVVHPEWLVTGCSFNNISNWVADRSVLKRLFIAYLLPCRCDFNNPSDRAEDFCTYIVACQHIYFKGPIHWYMHHFEELVQWVSNWEQSFIRSGKNCLHMTFKMAIHRFCRVCVNHLSMSFCVCISCQLSLPPKSPYPPGNHHASHF